MLFSRDSTSEYLELFETELHGKASDIFDASCEKQFQFCVLHIEKLHALVGDDEIRHTVSGNERLNGSIFCSNNFGYNESMLKDRQTPQLATLLQQETDR